jgi:hypothetical protein
VDAHFGLFGDSAHPDARYVFVPNVTQALKSFWTYQVVVLGGEALVDAHFSSIGHSANLHAR